TMDGEAHPLQLVVAAAGADLRARGDEQLHVRIRGDHRADVAAVEDGATILVGEIALALDQGLADEWIDGDARGDAAGRLALQLRVGEIDLREVAGTQRRE